MPHKKLFRGNVARGISSGKSAINRETGTITGFAVISKGEAKGHDMQIDETSLQQVVSLGNQSEIGIKSRFGHPNMSSDALGTFIGRAKNFRLEGDVVRADLHLDKSAYKTPSGDLANYVLNLAESDPNAFGASIVWSGTSEPVLNPDGTPKKDPTSGEALFPVARIKELFAVDATDEPAANDGMFSHFSPSVIPSAEMSKFLDGFLSRPDAVERVVSFLKRYSENNAEPKEKKNKEDFPMTLEEFKKNHPELAEQFSKEVREKALSDGIKKGVEQERERAVEVFKVSKEFEQFGLQKVAEESIREGRDKDLTVLKFKEARADQIIAGGNKSPGASPSTETPPGSALSSKDQARKEWDKDAALRDEFFNNFEEYVAYKEAIANDRVKFATKK